MIEMTRVKSVLCPKCGGNDCSLKESRITEVGADGIWLVEPNQVAYDETWICNSCMHKFITGCERKLVYYCYLQEDGEYSDEYEIEEE